MTVHSFYILKSTAHLCWWFAFFKKINLDAFWFKLILIIAVEFLEVK